MGGFEQLHMPFHVGPFAQSWLNWVTVGVAAGPSQHHWGYSFGAQVFGDAGR